MGSASANGTRRKTGTYKGVEFRRSFALWGWRAVVSLASEDVTLGAASCGALARKIKITIDDRTDA